MDNITDSDIILLISNPSTSELGFRKLVIKYRKPVYWHIRRMVVSHDDADDVTQDTFVKIWKHINTFRSDSKLFTWIYSIATNETITFLNRRKRFLFFSFHNIEEQLSNSLKDDNFFSGNEAELLLQKAILTLPEKQRLVFNMKYYDNITYEDMSAILKTSEGALKASYHHAVKKIEKFIQTR